MVISQGLGLSTILDSPYDHTVSLKGPSTWWYNWFPTHSGGSLFYEKSLSHIRDVDFLNDSDSTYIKDLPYSGAFPFTMKQSYSDPVGSHVQDQLIIPQHRFYFDRYTVSVKNEERASSNPVIEVESNYSKKLSSVNFFCKFLKKIKIGVISERKTENISDPEPEKINSVNGVGKSGYKKIINPSITDSQFAIEFDLDIGSSNSVVYERRGDWVFSETSSISLKAKGRSYLIKSMTQEAEDWLFDDTKTAYEFLNERVRFLMNTPSGISGLVLAQVSNSDLEVTDFGEAIGFISLVDFSLTGSHDVTIDNPVPFWSFSEPSPPELVLEMTNVGGFSRGETGELYNRELLIAEKLIY